MERARNDGGPTILHVKLSRYFGHYEGDAMTYRGDGEVEAARQKADALDAFRRQVIEAALLDTAELDTVDREVADLIAQSVVDAKAAPMPSAADLTTDVYVSY